MSFRLKGDFAGLQRKIDQLAKPDAALRAVSEAMADEALNLINDGFGSESAPDGTPWEPLKLRSGKILQDKGGMAASWHRSKANRLGFKVRSGKQYASFHQTGTGIYGPSGKPIVPTNGKALAFEFHGATQVFGRGKRLKRPKAIMSQVVVRSVKGVPPRKMVPDPGQPIPTRWKQRLVHAAKASLKLHFGA